MHETTMKSILRDIFSDSSLQAQLVFKGGTCLYLFYGLPRFSTDLDFSLHESVELDEVVVNKVTEIVGKHLDVSEVQDKRFTWFWLGSFEKGKQKVKVEISKRKFSDLYEQHEFYGLSVPSLSLESMFAHKLCAIIDRKQLVNRDLYDVWWLLGERVKIRNVIVEERMNMPVVEYLRQVVEYVKENVNRAQVLQGLGEVLDQSQKVWVKDKLVDDLLFRLQLRIEELEK